MQVNLFSIILLTRISLMVGSGPHYLSILCGDITHSTNHVIELVSIHTYQCHQQLVSTATTFCKSVAIASAVYISDHTPSTSSLMEVAG